MDEGAPGYVNNWTAELCIELYAVEVGGVAPYKRAESVRPKFEVSIRVITCEHPSSLLSRKVMLRLELTCLL